MGHDDLQCTIYWLPLKHCDWQVHTNCYLDIRNGLWTSDMHYPSLEVEVNWKAHRAEVLLKRQCSHIEEHWFDAGHCCSKDLGWRHQQMKWNCTYLCRQRSTRHHWWTFCGYKMFSHGIPGLQSWRDCWIRSFRLARCRKQLAYIMSTWKWNGMNCLII